MDESPSLHTLSEQLVHELAKAVALPRSRLASDLARLLFGPATRLFAQLALDLDAQVAAGGLAGGARWVLPRFAKSCEARGTESIPPDGPLVIAANHPGSFDSVAISAHVMRPDYKIIIGDIPFFQALPHISARALFAPADEDIRGRMRVLRDCLRHLQGGGALLIFARGGIEADPSFMPDAGAEFPLWSRSLEIFLHHIPQTRVLVTIVSGVISQSAFRHPLTWLRKARADRQRLAFMYQMVRQMLSGQEVFGMIPRVTFGEIVAGISKEFVPEAVEAAAARTLARHLAWAS
jgi:hypothetical protein